LQHSGSGSAVWFCPRCRIAYSQYFAALTHEIVWSELSDHQYPRSGDNRFSQAIPKSTLEKINYIREQALSHGWHEDRLYQNRGLLKFPYGGNWGLVCYVFEKVEPLYEGSVVRKGHIGEVTRQHIEIITDNYGVSQYVDKTTWQTYFIRRPSPANARMYFQNPDAEQVYAKRIKALETSTK
jgi:hypothetical protein